MNLQQLIFPLVLSAVLFSLGDSTVAQKPKINGRNVEMQTEWLTADAGCYRIKVTMSTSPKLPVKSREEYLVVVKQRDYQSDFITTAKPLVIEAGDSTGEVELNFPLATQQNWGYGIDIHIETNNNLRRDRFDMYSYHIDRPYQQTSSMPAILLVSSKIGSIKSHTVFVANNGKIGNPRTTGYSFAEKDLPSIHLIQPVYPEAQMNWSNQIAAVKNPTASDTLKSDRFHAISPADLPETWIGLSAADIIMMPFSDLSALSSQSTAKMQALQNWCAAGGTLVVNGCGKQLENADAARQLLTKESATLGAKRSPWQVPAKKLLNEDRVIDYDNSGAQLTTNLLRSYTRFYQKRDSLVKQVTTEKLKQLAEKNPNSIAFTEFSLGRVIVTGGDMNDWKFKDWAILLNTIQQKEFLLSKRLGATQHIIQSPNISFAVPGVGNPPVYLFQILITAFLLAVGPVSYVLLKRKMRLQLLFVTAPILSMLACMGLVGYAFIADGFQVRGRVASFTAIDHVAETAVSFVRHSNYSGITPAPYKFKANQIVVNGRADYSPGTVYRETDDEFKVYGGDIRPRTPHQMTAVQAESVANDLGTAYGLQLQPSEDGTPLVQNGFDNKVELAFFRFGKSIYRVENLAPGDTQRGEKTKTSDAHAKIAKLRMELSPDVEYENYRSTFSNAVTVAWAGAQTVNTDDHFSDIGIKLAGKRGANMLGDERNYLAVLKEYDQVTLPQEGIDYRSKVHIVWGKW